MFWATVLHHKALHYFVFYQYPYEHNQDDHEDNDNINNNRVLDSNDLSFDRTQNNVEPYDVV